MSESIPKLPYVMHFHGGGEEEIAQLLAYATEKELENLVLLTPPQKDCRWMFFVVADGTVFMSIGEKAKELGLTEVQFFIAQPRMLVVANSPENKRTLN